MKSIPILYNEPFFAVINKPAGLFTQAASGVESVESILRKQWQPVDSASLPFVGLPHRLDRGTSGALLIARNQRALQRLGEQFHSRKIHKRYLAVLFGTVIPGSGDWVDYVRKIPDRPVAEVTNPQTEDAKEARLSYRTLANENGLSLVDIELHTGRMHQIRIQAASRGFPVFGDWCYGDQHLWGEVDERGERTALALHAAMIEFRNPQNAKLMRIVATLPDLLKLHLPVILFESAQDFLKSQELTSG